MKTLYCSGIIVCNLLLGGALAAQPLPKVQLRPAFPKLTLDHPLYMAEAPDGSGRMFTVEQIGRILVVPKDTDGSQSNEFLNIVDRHPFAAYEEGLLSIAFHPDFKRNGLCYILLHRREYQRPDVSSLPQHPQRIEGFRQRPEPRRYEIRAHPAGDATAVSQPQGWIAAVRAGRLSLREHRRRRHGLRSLQ